LEYSKILLEYSKLLLEYSQKAAEDVFRSKEQRKMDFPLVVCSLIRNFSLREKVLSLEIPKKNKFSFGCLLTYS